MGSEVEEARVGDEFEPSHATLFPVSACAPPLRAPRELCRAVGLNWLAAQRLHQQGMLSFDPKKTADINAAQQAELRFLGTLVAGGCDESLLAELLRTLTKPYAYRLERMHYDWSGRTWKLLPSDRDLRQQFRRWVDEMEDAAAIESLEELQVVLTRAIRDLRAMCPW